MADHLKITDSRTDNSFEVPITNDTIPAIQLRQIKTNKDDFGMMSYDPAFQNTAACTSRVTDLDGAKGILRYRGYPIEDLAENSSFLESAYLLIHGELPNRSQLDEWEFNVMHHSGLHENTKDLMEAFKYDAHPMGVLVSTVAALSTFYPKATDVHNEESRKTQIYRLIGKMPTIAAFSLRKRLGWPYVYPNEDMSYTGNLLYMLTSRPGKEYEANPVLDRALDTIFLLHADHEQNCSTTAMRCIGSSMADPFMATAGAAAALSGPLHGGANERVLRQLGTLKIEDVPALIKKVKAGEERLMGFGHRVYKSYDPRAKILRDISDEVFEVTGKNPLIDVAKEVERIALEDEYFVKKNLYPNVDFYSGIVLQAMHFPISEFTVLFAIARTAGWVAQWLEMLGDAEQKIARPRQVYLGEGERKVVPIDQRG